RRREFVTLGFGAAAAFPLATRAQPAMPVVGFVGSDTPDLYAERLRAFRLGLKVAGFTEGQNVTVEYRGAEGRNDGLPALTADLVRRQVAVIVATTLLRRWPLKRRPRRLQSSFSSRVIRSSLGW